MKKPNSFANPGTWKKAEGRVAAIFRARRQIMSGSCGRDDQTRSDTTHARLFIETKYRIRHSARTLHEKTKALARREGKTPVIALIDKGHHGILFGVHSDDLPAFVAEYTLANPVLVEEAMRRARGGTADEPTQRLVIAA